MRKWAKFHQGLFMQSIYQWQSRSETFHLLICLSVIQGQFPMFFFCLDREMTQLHAVKRKSL